MPVLTVKNNMSLQPRPAPYRASPSAPAFASFSTNTNSRSRLNARATVTPIKSGIFPSRHMRRMNLAIGSNRTAERNRRAARFRRSGQIRRPLYKAIHPSRALFARFPTNHEFIDANSNRGEYELGGPPLGVGAENAQEAPPYPHDFQNDRMTRVGLLVEQRPTPGGGPPLR